jgi:HD superfamily phosphohydrolase
MHYRIIQHPYFQRLRRLRQLGFSYYVYPGATHTRFDHVLGAMHLMTMAIRELEKKGADIRPEEKEAVLTAILLHDIGHGPLSHSLEGCFMRDIHHEDLSLIFMEHLNQEIDNRLSLGISIFKNEYPKKFLHDLVSGQLDTDRLDYLKRDSFYTGVSEGEIGSDRIIKMLRIHDDKLAVEEKGIYSVEQFLIARRIMYWQVYLHKTVIAAEVMVKKAIKRARELFGQTELFVTPTLRYFFENDISAESLKDPDTKAMIMHQFANLDDSDIIVSLKEWAVHPDKILSVLSRSLINRDLFKVEISNSPFPVKEISRLKSRISDHFDLDEDEISYFVFSDIVKNKAYSTDDDIRINILLNSGTLSDIAEASDLSNISALSKAVEKYFLCFPKLSLPGV